MSTIKSIYYNSILKNQDAASTIHPLDTKRVKEAYTIGSQTMVYKNGKSFNSVKSQEMTNRVKSTISLFEDVKKLTMPANRKTETAEELSGRVMSHAQAISRIYMPSHTPIDINAQVQAYKMAQRNGQFISFDTELMGGVDGFGANRLDAITELAYSVSDTVNQDANVALQNTKDYFFGINKETYERLMIEVKQPGFATSTNRGKVIAERLAIASHPDTIIDGNHIISQGNPGKSVPTVAQMIKGLNVNRAASILDESTLGPDGLTDGQRFINEFVQIANKEDVVVAGHNILNFDVVKMASQDIDLSKAKKLDTLSTFQAASKTLTSNQIFEMVEDIHRGMPDKTTYTQENLISLIAGEQTKGLQAHAAKVDTGLHTLIVNHPIMKTAIEHLDSEAIRGVDLGELTPGKSLILNRQSTYGDYHSLSMINLPNGELNIGNGYSLINGKIVENGYKPGIMKKDALYVFDGVGELALTDQQRKAMKLVDADYAQKTLNYAIYTPFGADGTIQGEGTILEFFKSPEHMQKRLNGQLHIADKIKEDVFELPTNINARQLALEELMEYDLTQDKPVGKALKLDEYIQKKALRAKTDRAGRKVRNHSLDDTKKLLSFMDEVKSYADAHKVIEPISGIGISDMQLSIKLANNQKVTIENGLEMMNSKIGTNAKYNSIDNLLNMTPFMYKNENTIRQVHEYVANNFKDQAQQRHAYESIMSQIIGNVNTKSEPLRLSKNDLNYIEIPRDKLKTVVNRGEAVKSAEDMATKYVRINLDKNNAAPQLINSLLENKYGSKRKTITGQNAELQGKVVLDELLKVLNINDIDSEDYDKVNDMAEAALLRLRQKKENNLFYGIHQKTTTQAIENGGISIAEIYAKSNLDLTGAIEEAGKHVPSVQNLSKVRPEHLAQKIVKNFNEQLNPNYFYDFGFDKKHADFMTHVFSQWQREQEDFYTQVFKQLKHYDGLGVIIDGDQFKLTYGQQVIDMSHHVPRLVTQGDMAYVAVGNMQVGLEGVVRHNPNSKGTFELATNFQRSVDRARIGFTRPKQRIDAGKLTPAEAIEGMFKHVNSYIFESPDVKAKNRMNQIRQYDVDVNDVRKYIPVLVERGDITVTKNEMRLLKKFADPENTGRLGMLGDKGNISLENVLSKYINQATAILFNNTEYEGSLLKVVGEYAMPYASEKRVSDGILSMTPNVDAFGEYGPGNRITRFQNNFMSYDIGFARENLKELSELGDVPVHSFDQGATSHYGHKKGVWRLNDFKQLDKEYSDQIVLKKLNISHNDFKTLVEKHFSGGPVDGYTEVQWSKIHDKMRQYALNEDESIMDARMLENVFWQQNEVQKIREKRGAANDFVRDKRFLETHQVLDYVIAQDESGQATFSYGGSIDRSRNDPLFKISGYHDTEQLTLASYDGKLKKGVFSDKENIMLTEGDINQLIKGMSKEEAENYIDGLQSYYYLERKNKESYVKYIVGNTEKTKSRSLFFSFGELDEELAEKFPSLAGETASIQELKARAKKLGATEEDLRRIQRERYAIDVQRNLALGDKNISLVTDPSIVKHKGIDTQFRQIFPSLRQKHMDEDKMDIKSAALQVKENFKNLGFTFDVAEDGSMLFEDSALERSMDFEGVKKVIGEKYKNLDPDLLEETVFVDGKYVGTTGMVNVARTKEYEISIVSQPIKTTDQYYEMNKQISGVNDKIKAREAMLKELTTPEEIQINGDEPWYEEYEKLKSNIQMRRENTEKAIRNIEVNLDIDKETQNHLVRLNSCTKDYDDINKTIRKREKLAREYSTIVNDANVSPETRRKYVTLANNNHKMLEAAKEIKIQIADDRQTAMFVYVNALEQNTKNKRSAQKAIGIANYNFNKGQRKLTKTLEGEIKGYKHIAKNLNTELKEFSSAYKQKNEGITVDERAFMKLRGKKLTSTIYDNLKLLKEDELLEKFNITKGAVDNSRPIFSTIIDDLIEMGLTNSAHEVLTPESAEKTINKLYGTSKVSQGILNVFNNSNRDKLSVEIAEARYALGKMDRANAFNNNKETADYLKSVGFDEIDIRHYQTSRDYDADALKRGNSVFGKNLILDVNGEKVAVPYMPHSVYGETPVQKRYESSIATLQNAVNDLEVMNKDADLEAYGRAEDKVKDAVQAVKDSVHVLTAKESNVAEAITKSKYDLGFLAKSASYDGPLDADLTNAFYKGKSIADWQKENVFINAGFTSKKMFKDMGFFGEDLKDSFKDGDMLFNDKDLLVKGRVTDEQLEKAYKKYGVSGLSGRFPYIQEMSINAKQLYLSDSIEGNTIKNFLAEQAGKSSDNDGDYEAFMALKAGTKTGDYSNAFILQALGQTSDSLDEHDLAIGLDALGANRYRKKNMDFEAGIKQRMSDAEKIMERASVYDRMFFDGKMIGEATTNPYYDKNFSIDTVNNKLAELEELTGKTLNLEKPNEVAALINGLEDGADKEGYKKAVVDRIAVSSLNLAQTAKTMKKAVGEVNLMMYDIDQASEILADNEFITERQKKAVGEISYAIQQESISPKNAKDGDINIDSIEDFKRIVTAARYNDPIEYEGEIRSATDALGVYLDNNIRETYLKKYAGKESPEYIFESQVQQKAIFDLTDISEDQKAKLWKTKQKELSESYYQDSKKAIQSVFSQISTTKMTDVSAYNKLFTKSEATAKFYNTDAAKKGVTRMRSQKDLIMQMADDVGHVYETENVKQMVSPSNSTFRHMFATEEDMIEMANQAAARQSVTKSLTENMNDGFKVTGGMAAMAIAGVGAYMLMGAVGSSVTANTTNQAEGMQTTGDTLSDYGSDYEMGDGYTHPNRGYVINVNAKTSPQNAQRIAGKVNQSISSSLNANLNMTLNVNETPLKQFQINKLIQDSLFSG